MCTSSATIIIFLPDSSWRNRENRPNVVSTRTELGADVNNIAFPAGYNPAFIPAALQQRFASCMANAATANDDCRVLDKAQPYAARGILCGVAIAIPMWAIIAEMTSFAYGTIG